MMCNWMLDTSAAIKCFMMALCVCIVTIHLIIINEKQLLTVATLNIQEQSSTECYTITDT